MNYFYHHIGDYRADTSHLTLLEHGVYRQLLDTYYLNEAPLPADIEVVCRKLSARTDDERQAVSVVLKEFFTLTDNGWTHKRCDAEIGKFLEFREAGKRGAAKRWLKEPQCPADGEGNSPPNQGPMPTNNQYPITKNQTTKTPKAQAPVDVDRFADFWAAYPRKVSKPEALKAWIKVKPDDETFDAIMTGLSRAKQSRDWQKEGGQFIPHPATWLNNRRWEDDVAGVTASDDPFAGAL